MKIGNRFFDTKNHTYIMGILNVTPDSFSDGGKWNHIDEALKHTEAMIADGADIIDIGGESTRPGHTPVSADEEAQRVLPVIEAVKKHFDIPVSVDTFKSSVAESSIQAGADLVNDIWGLKYDPNMAAVIAKYDVACTSSGASRAAGAGGVGSCYAPGCCHAFTADGRCVSLLKVLMTNCCSFDCSYCVNRKSNDVPRATFTPRELAELTIEFYRRNYIEGLFLSSAVLVNPDYTTERMLAVLRLLRGEYRFGGYIHAKAIPGTSPELLEQLGFLADRLSVNIELPSERSLNLLAPDKGRHSIFRPMKQIAVEGAANREEVALYRRAPRFAPAGQSTQMIVGASPETDYHILQLTEGLYNKYHLKRVFYSAYIPVTEDTRLPALDTKPPLLREHRLYQADWLLRFYEFKAEELLDRDNPNFNPYLDPKCNWAVQHYGLFPVDVNRAPFEMLLRVPGIGPKSARRIWHARKQAALGLDELKRMGVVLKRAQYFITCRGFAGAHPGRGSAGRERITRALIDPNVFSGGVEQLSMFSPPAVDRLVEQGVPPRTAQKMVREEAVQCLARAL